MIIKYPNKFLHEPTVMVDLPLNTDHELLIKTMIKEMYKNNGVGLAANQIGSSSKIFVIDISNERNNPQIFINPIIKKQSKEKLTQEEGCLSCPGQLGNVRRPIYIALKWFCEHGKEKYKTFYNFPARVVQHEMDHLNGKLCIDMN
jgi:peptide deformylase